MFNLAPMREAYMRAGLAERDAAADPLLQFEAWFNDAVTAALPLPNAMTLSTVSAEGQPSSRAVLLKGVDHGGFVFYTNYLSRKGRDIDANPHAALLFAWLALERQVRIEGVLTRITSTESDAYFDSRPLGSRHAAIASPQSEVLANRAALEKKFDEVASSTGATPKRPQHWGGYRLMPQAIEFWQGRENRLHDRLLYTRHKDGWNIKRLAP